MQMGVICREKGRPAFKIRGMIEDWVKLAFSTVFLRVQLFFFVRMGMEFIAFPLITSNSFLTNEQFYLHLHPEFSINKAGGISLR
ncbi:hypothetical protein BZG02_14505 [Labilibaculum filiforme]|uniref:Uncharacterized protein n=2 Tax=Labilibaculum filiforme TaxID=1940526 RepID=A0A2N3HUU5_9BACT|nr:hypothetical protein BZG02_14505 [Labilibaculum filiforme]